MSQPIHILVVEDVPTDAELAQREVRKVLPGSEFLRVENQDAFLAALNAFRPDLIISDYKLPQFDGMRVLKLALTHMPEIPFIMLTGSMNEDTAVECMKGGAWDYVIKEHIKRLGPAVVSALEQKRLRAERRQAEQALRESEALFKNLFENHAAVKLLTDPGTGRIIDANKAAESYYGWPRARLRQMRLEDITALPPGTGKVDASGQNPLEFRHKLADGSIRDVQVLSSKIELQNRTLLYSIIQDITEKKKLELDLIEKNQEMESFLYITTHDLRSPLVNIQGFSQNLQRYTKELREALSPAPLPEETKAELQKIAGESIPVALKFVLESAQKMDALITALLKVSRIGRLEMKPETLNMNAVIQTILDSIRFQLNEAGGKVQAGPLPQCNADQGAISRVFTNLLNNAIKYKSKDRPLEVNIAGEVFGDKVIYTVSDNGPGIPAKDLPRILDIFSQPVSAAGRKGEGIGLAIVRRLAEKNGGRIRVESKEGEGSVFYIELPAAG